MPGAEDTGDLVVPEVARYRRFAVIMSIMLEPC